MRKLTAIIIGLIFTAIVVTPASASANWTFMVYLDADNNLEQYGIEDFNEMEMAGSTSDVNIVVQFDRTPSYDTTNGDWTTTRRYYVTYDTDPQIINSTLIADLGELDMANPRRY